MSDDGQEPGDDGRTTGSDLVATVLAIVAGGILVLFVALALYIRSVDL